MSEAAIGEGMAGGPAMPRAHVLSYVAKVTSATEVRRVARRFVRILGLLHVLLAVLWFGWVGWMVMEDIRSYFEAYRFSFGWAEVMHYFRLYGWDASAGSRMFTQGSRDAVMGIFIPGFVASFGIGLLFCAGPVVRGSKQGCVMSMVCLVPSIFAGFAAAAVCGSMGLLLGFGLFGARQDMWQLGWLLLVPVMAVVVTALWDLWGFLDWIIRNPAAEKPKVTFLA